VRLCYCVQLRAGYGGKLTKIKTFEACQSTQFAGDESCQLICIYKTIEEINCETDPNNVIVSN
jgi:hypothetical protein